VVSRLAENKLISVVVPEAGPNAENFQEVLPSIFFALSIIDDCFSLGIRSWASRNWSSIHYTGLVILDRAAS
jgi:hypothetical protein